MSNVFIEPTSPWGRDRALAINRERNLMVAPGQRDIEHGTPVIAIDPNLPSGPVYQPDLYLPGRIGAVAPVRWDRALAALGLVAFAAAILGAVT